jgi:rhodanese-related sulfurtransferase
MANRVLTLLPNEPGNPPEVDVAETARQLASGEAQIVDVREPEEWAEGRIAGAVLISLGELPNRLGELDPTRPAIAVCRSGQRSLWAAETLLANGFSEAASLRGGMIAWAQAGQPVAD